jgi:hypothetical protein
MLLSSSVGEADIIECINAPMHETVYVSAKLSFMFRSVTRLSLMLTILPRCTPLFGVIYRAQIRASCKYQLHVIKEQKECRRS